MVVLFAFLAFLGLLVVLPFLFEAKRRRTLVKVTNDYEVDRAIIDRRLFEGMSQGQLHQAWGPPEEIAVHPGRGRRRETWLYGADGRGRFHHHVQVKDGIVVKWKHGRGNGRRQSR